MGLALPPHDSSVNFQLLVQACAAEKRASEAVVPGEYRNTKGVSQLKGSANKAIGLYSGVTARALTNVPFSRLDSDERMLRWQNRSQEWVIPKTVIVNPFEEFRRSRLREARSARHSSHSSADHSTLSNATAYSKQMCPESYLDFAARHSDKALATKEGVSLEVVNEAIEDAAHYVAARDMRSVMAIFLEFERDRLRHNIHATHKDFVRIINHRARRHFRECGIEKIDLSRSSCPCTVWDKGRGHKRRCRKHDICALMHMQQLTKGKWEAEQAEKLLREPVKADDSPELPCEILEVSD